MTSFLIYTRYDTNDAKNQYLFLLYLFIIFPNVNIFAKGKYITENKCHNKSIKLRMEYYFLMYNKRKMLRFSYIKKKKKNEDKSRDWCLIHKFDLFFLGKKKLIGKSSFFFFVCNGNPKKKAIHQFPVNVNTEYYIER